MLKNTTGASRYVCALQTAMYWGAAIPMRNESIDGRHTQRHRHSSSAHQGFGCAQQCCQSHRSDQLTVHMRLILEPSDLSFFLSIHAALGPLLLLRADAAGAAYGRTMWYCCTCGPDGSPAGRC